MFFFFRMAVRNLLRMPRRTLTTGITIAVCVAALIIMRSLVIGSARDMRERLLDTHYPDVYVYAEGYTGCDGYCTGSLKTLVNNYHEVRKALEKESTVKVVAPRMKFRARLSDGVDLIPCQIIAGVQSRERSLFQKVKLVSGRWLKDDEDDVALIGVHLARSMEIKIGSTITLLAQSCEGALSAVDVKVVGTIYSGSPYADGETVFLPMSTGQKLGETEDSQCSHFCLRMKERAEGYPYFLEPASEVAGQKLVALTWYERTWWIRVLTARRTAGVAVAAFFMALTVIIGVANALLMSVHERRREIGTLLALGFTRIQIVKLFVAEGFCLGCSGALTGAIGGALGASYYENVGLALDSDPATVISLVPRKIYAMLTFDSVFFAFLFGVLVVTLSSFYPAVRGSSLLPADSLRR